MDVEAEDPGAEPPRNFQRSQRGSELAQVCDGVGANSVPGDRMMGIASISMVSSGE